MLSVMASLSSAAFALIDSVADSSSVADALQRLSYADLLEVVSERTAHCRCARPGCARAIPPVTSTSTSTSRPERIRFCSEICKRQFAQTKPHNDGVGARTAPVLAPRALQSISLASAPTPIPTTIPTPTPTPIPIPIPIRALNQSARPPSALSRAEFARLSADDQVDALAAMALQLKPQLNRITADDDDDGARADTDTTTSTATLQTSTGAVTVGVTTSLQNDTRDDRRRRVARSYHALGDAAMIYRFLAAVTTEGTAQFIGGQERDDAVASTARGDSLMRLLSPAFRALDDVVTVDADDLRALVNTLHFREPIPPLSLPQCSIVALVFSCAIHARRRTRGRTNAWRNDDIAQRCAQLGYDTATMAAALSLFDSKLTLKPPPPPPVTIAPLNAFVMAAPSETTHSLMSFLHRR